MIVFMSDNGGPTGHGGHAANNWPLRGAKVQGAFSVPKNKIFLYKKFWLTDISLPMRMVTLQQHICTFIKMMIIKGINLQNREACGRVAPELLLLSIRRVRAECLIENFPQ